MNSMVHITLTSSEGFPAVVPIGAVVNYGVNKIPTAMVALDPSSLNLLCNFDDYRRKNVTLNIETTNGCLHFPGMVDGLSFSQTPGGLSASLILKHPFQWLTELYPRIIGLAPTTANMFRCNKTLDIAWSSVAEGEIFDQIKNYGLEHLDFTKNIVDFYVNMMIVAAASQNITQWQENDGTVTVGLQRILAASKTSQAEFRNLVIALLREIDTTATKPCTVTASSSYIADQVMQDLAMMRDNIFANLVRLLSNIGCCIVVGNSGAFIVPEASYLYVHQVAKTERGHTSTTPNLIYPAEYDHFSFNDNGFVNIKGVYTIADQGVSIANVTPGATVDMGQYIDPDPNAYGNIATTTLPCLISYGLIEAAVKGAQGIQSRIPSGTPLLPKQILVPNAKIAVSLSNAQSKASLATRQIYMNDWAEIEYCKLKYDDRTGNINSYFRNNWAPGAVGTLYTKQPGTFIDFFVTDVTHSFAVSVPNQGSATTNITFKSGRMGSAGLVGLETVSLYSYNYAAAQAFSQAFINDIK